MNASPLRYLVATLLLSPFLAFGQTKANAPSTLPLPAPKFSQSTLPANAQKATDATGRTIIGTNRQRMHLLDPAYGAAGAGSHKPPLFNAEQQAAASSIWNTYSPEEKRSRMAKLSEKMREAHLSFIKEHPDQVRGTQPKVKGSVEIPLHGTKLRFEVDGRQSDIPVGFRDQDGRRVLKTPATISDPSPKVVADATLTQMNTLGRGTKAPGAWHKLDSVMRRNKNTGDHLAFLRVMGQQGTGGGPGICPAWGCGGCPPSACYGITLGGPDTDGDGIPDALEASLGGSFTPTYHVSKYEQSGTGFAIMQDASPENVQATYGPLPPISYYRVEPSNFIDSGLDASGNTVYHRYLRIDYLTLWNEDDGLAHGLTCDLAVSGDLGFAFNFLTAILGFDVAGASAGLGGHYLDDEHSAVLLAVQVTGPNDMTLPTDYTLYSAVGYYAAAHEHTSLDASQLFFSKAPVSHDTHIDLYLSQSKHSTYFFNPDRKPILVSRDELNYIEAAFIPIFGYNVYWDYYDDCPVDPDYYYIVLPDGEVYFAIDNGDGSCYIPVQYYDPIYVAELEILTEEVFADCTAEHFTEQGPSFAQQMINVGEPNNPTPGNHFIQDPTPDLAGSKLRQSIFPAQHL